MCIRPYAFSFDFRKSEDYGFAMKQFIIIVLAILVSVGIIGIVIGVYQAKVGNDKFKQDMQEFNDDSKKANPNP